MENRGKRQSASIFGGMGFYIALLICVVAAGVVGYFALLKSNPEPIDDPIPSAVTAPDPVQDVAKPAPEPAKPVIKDTPIPVEQPVVRPILEEDPPEEPAAAFPNEDDAPPITEAPVQAVEPMVIVAPLAGDTVAAFSVDSLSYDATLGDWRTHDGIDISAEAGTPVAAASAGVVLSAGDDGRMGPTVTIDHRNGYITTYSSLQPELNVHAGDEIPAGAILGSAGNTSLAEVGLGAHLHFSVSKDGDLIDPVEFLGLD